MNKFGFIRTCACAPQIKVADVDFNKQEIIKNIISIRETGANIILFPELSITGYTCGDLFQQDILLKKAKEALNDIANCTDSSCIIVVGLPMSINNRLWNVAAICSYGKVIAYIPKSYLPSYKEYYESRWFQSGMGVNFDYEGVPFNPNTLIDIDAGDFNFKLGVEICEDVWMPLPPSTLLALNGVTMILNPSASTETIGKSEYRRELISQNSARNVLAYLYAASGPSESTTDVVFSGHCIAAEYGSVISESELYGRKGTSIIADFDMSKLDNERRKLTTFGDQSQAFDQDFFGKQRGPTIHIKLHTTEGLHLKYIDPAPFVPSNKVALDKRAKEIFDIQTNALITRLEYKNTSKVVIGISGGLDSTLALLVAVKTFDMMKKPRSGIVGITMPGFGTTSKTKGNASLLMEALGITSVEISIKEACIQHFSDISLPADDRSITYENCQARERTQILMDYANKVGGMVLGTGDMSELALGWCTYNGDHMSMYNVNCSIPKTLVKFLVAWTETQKEFENCKEILESICNTTISPELLPPDEKGEIKQSTEDSVGPYVLNDFFLYYHIRWNFTPEKIRYLASIAFKGIYSKETIIHWSILFYKRFFAAQFKRSCAPDGPKVGSISLSPRGDWRMPSDASSDTWTNW